MSISGDYNIYLQQSYSIEFFDAGGDYISQMVNYNFNRTVFYCDDEGKLFLARVFQPDLSEKMGDYPIITTDKAYRTAETEEYYMPYYRFYVELPEEAREGGIKTYGAYYVPAVESIYIANMPVWDGSFN